MIFTRFGSESAFMTFKKIFIKFLLILLYGNIVGQIGYVKQEIFTGFWILDARCWCWKDGRSLCRPFLAVLYLLGWL